MHVLSDMSPFFSFLSCFFVFPFKRSFS
jgi:hypothetical protein